MAAYIKRSVLLLILLNYLCYQVVLIMSSCSCHEVFKFCSIFLFFYFLLPATFFFSFVFVFISCYLKKVECRNHIRVIQPMDSGTRLYVCGTNAHNPKDYVINVSRHYNQSKARTRKKVQAKYKERHQKANVLCRRRQNKTKRKKTK